jgi:virginiamycin B lyase
MIMGQGSARKLFKTRKVQLLLVAVVVAAILAPDGFFSGHRRVVLEAETSVSEPEVYTGGDETLKSAILRGTIVTSGKLPVSGAMITAFNADKTRKITVYSHPDGSYRLPISFTGEISVRARTPYFSDKTREVTIADGGNLVLDIMMERMSDPQNISESLPASAHAAALKWPKDTDRATFISQCNFCHQMGNALTRRPRVKEEWDAVIDRMEGYLIFVTNNDKERIASNLHETFNGEPVRTVQTWDVSPNLANARIEEWVAGDALSFIHDADVGHDGRLYGVDEGHDIIWELDTGTGEILQVKLPDVDLPVGGKFSGLALPIGVFTGKHGPHSMAEGNDGRLWITNSLSSRLMAYTAETNIFETFDIAADTLYLHTIRTDPEGRLWFTVVASNQVGRFDPETRQLDLLDLPANGAARWLTDAIMPALMRIGAWFPRKNIPIKLSHHGWTGLGRNVMGFPYGIDVNPIDGSIWYAKLYANKLGRIDPETLEIIEFDTPAIGPRRPRFAPNGILWVPGFDSGELVSFDPNTEKFRAYPLPTLAPNEYETPYALNVHPQTGLVWITSNMSDRIFSFDPKTESFTSYPLPTRVSFLRDMVFTEDGKVCSSNSNLPAYAIEGGLGGFICLDPDGSIK